MQTVKIDIKDFILKADNALSIDDCHRLMEYTNEVQTLGLGHTRRQDDNSFKHEKDDYNFAPEYQKLEWPSGFPACTSAVMECLRQYAEKYSIVNHYPPLAVHHLKLQKTEVSGGYHIWHTENVDPQTKNRAFAWMIYLNDVEEGGETEFLYYARRIKPTQGTLLMWPAYFTHAHRGNPPLSNTKYIITGWIEF